MPRRAFHSPLQLRALVVYTLLGIGCFKPPESLAGPFISPTWLNSHSLENSKRCRGNKLTVSLDVSYLVATEKKRTGTLL